MLWLRWRLSRNQWLRGGALGQVAGVIATVSAVTLGAGAFVGAFFSGWFALAEASPMAVMITWDVVAALFCFMWLIGMVAEIQRSETIDLQRLMHLPVRLGPLFLVNYAASHLAFSVIVMVPAMIGLGLGLVIGSGPWFFLVVPLALSLVFAVSAWSYCLRGWLAALMVNQRRRRSVVMLITLAIVLLGQAPNLYLNVMRPFNRRPVNPNATPEQREQARREAGQANQDMLQKFSAAHKFLPPLWVGAGARGLAEGDPIPALLGTAACAGLGALGLRRAYRGTVRFYRGETGSVPSAKPVTSPARAARPAKPDRFLEWRLPGVPEPAAAVALATVRSMQRAPEVKMLLVMPFVVLAIMAASFAARVTAKLPAEAAPFVVTGAAAVALFFTQGLLMNQFGFDRHGFRTLVLSPVDRRWLLLGKNLAALPVAGLLGTLMIVFVTVWLKVPPLDALAGLLQLFALALLVGALGNLASMLAPYRMRAGGMTSSKMPVKAVLVSLAMTFLLPVVCAPAVIPPLAEFLWRRAGWTAFVPVNLLLSLGLAALAVFGYRAALAPLGRLLERREKQILETVTAEVE
ncbi:MAG: hypothetical protein HY301_19650 [Verrucomicrobia bacterium]|nr:hypothetical protein [Verrucomicrobiota bacterium]